MSCNRAFTFLAIFGVLTFGVAMDARGGCDNDCRMRFYHFYCPLDPETPTAYPCVKFALPDCLLCNPAVSCDCDNSDAAQSNCVQTGSNIARKYESCGLVCACGTKAVVEAATPSGNFLVLGTDRYVCLGS